MNHEMQKICLSNFKDYLVKNGYSKHVVPIYVRKFKDFLNCSDLHPDSQMDYESLKKMITDYLANIPITSQKGTIQAALHAYYYFISGTPFFRRLNAKDFDADSSIDAEIDRFRKYLTEVAGLSENTIISQCGTIQIFLYSSFEGKDFSPGKVTSDHVRIYFSDTLRHVSVASKKSIIVRIRSYIRFLEFTDGFQSEEILKLPMTSPVWKRSGIPKYLTGEELTRLFSVYDQTNSVSIRNYAIVRCLKDLGLRCSEAAGISLDDIDWVQGTITIKNTKAHSKRILPLHSMTGQALEGYLVKARPVTSERILFVRFKNEQGSPMGVSQVRTTVRTAAVRAGLENFVGTHMLRHTAAKEMLDGGISLKTIADILGHESIETTSIYTKIDFIQLQDVAGTWPEVMK